MTSNEPISLDAIDHSEADAAFVGALEGEGSPLAEAFPPSGEKGWGSTGEKRLFPPSGEKGWGSS